MAVSEEMTRQRFELWFFKDLTDEQRLRLFKHFDFPVHEMGQMGVQRKAFRHILAMRAVEQPLSDSDDVVERVAKAISVPQHHTTWDLLSEVEKDLFYMQARAAIATHSLPEGDGLLRALPASVTSFIVAIMDRTPNGEKIVVQYHPNGDWFVAKDALSIQSGTGDGLREALEQIEGKARLGGDCLGNSPPEFMPCQRSFYMLADIARTALETMPEKDLPSE